MDAKGGIMMCKLKGRMDKGGHYDVERTFGVVYDHTVLNRRV